MKNDPFNIFSNLGTLHSSNNQYEYLPETEEGEALEYDEVKPNFLFLHFLVYFIALLLIFRLLDLQITKGSENQYLAEGNRIRSRDISAPRGNIYDRNMDILAKNMATFSLEIYPADLPKNKEQRQKIYAQIEENSQISQEEIKKLIEKKGLYSLESIVLKDNLAREEALLAQVKYQDLSGVIINAKPVRQYQSVPGLSHILGYIGKISLQELKNNPNYKLTDNFGKSGLELIYENKLKGQDGQEQVEVDSLGKIQRTLASRQPQPGNNLILTLDFDLQKKIAEVLSQMSSSLGNKPATAVALNPQNGQILALVNTPSYDNNIFSGQDIAKQYEKVISDKSNPFLNRAISGLYPSGSTIKPVIAAAGLEEGIITEKTTINDPGEIHIGEWVFPDWKNHGLTDVKKAIAESCNTFFYAVGGGWDKIKGLGINKLAEYLQKFAFGQTTGIDLPAEAKGLVPTPQWKKKNKKEAWYIGDTYHLSIGQGDLLVTPLQLANAIAVIANGGKLLVPQLFLQETDQNNKILKEFQEKVISQDFISTKNLQIVRQGMRQTVESGSARQLNDLPVTVAGKTGTAQSENNLQKTHAWFVSFAPYDNPQIVLVVLIEEGGAGNETALPVAKEILQYYFSR